METNETILARNVVALDNQKVLGKVAAVIIDCEKRAVSHFVLDSKDASSAAQKKRVLPFSKTINIGDSFVVVQNAEDLLKEGSYIEERTLSGYLLLETPVFTKAGNECGKVVSYSFDCDFGTVKEISLSNEKNFADSEFLFFTEEFVFVDDGAALSLNTRLSGKVEKEEKEVVASKPVVKISPVVEEELSVVEEELPVEEEPELTEEEENLFQLLEGLTLAEDVVSEDGELGFAQGTELTREVLLEAKEKEGLLMSLTLAVE